MNFQNSEYMHSFGSLWDLQEMSLSLVHDISWGSDFCTKRLESTEGGKSLSRKFVIGGLLQIDIFRGF